MSYWQAFQIVFIATWGIALYDFDDSWQPKLLAQPHGNVVVLISCALGVALMALSLQLLCVWWPR